MLKEVVQIDKTKIQNLRELTGEGNKSQINTKKIEVDYRKSEETYGNFAITEGRKENDKFIKEYKTIGKSFTGVILKGRYMVKGFDKSESKYYSYEFDDFNKEIVLFSTESRAEIERGLYRDLKDKYQLDKKLVLYVLYKEEIYRLILSGGTLSFYWEYLRFFTDTSVSLFVTEFKTSELQTNGNVEYFEISFSQAGLFDQNKAIDLVKKVHEDLELYEQTRDSNAEIIKNTKNNITDNEMPHVTLAEGEPMPEPQGEKIDVNDLNW